MSRGTWRRAYEALQSELISLIESAADSPEGWSRHPLWDDACFGELARRIFQFQRRFNPYYSAYCGVSGGQSPARWQDVPAVWTRAFKRAEVAVFPKRAAQTWFQTSGTTEGEPGFHYFASLALYEASVAATFPRFLLPDLPRIRMLILTPEPAEAPHSSLIHMMGVVKERFGTENSGFFMRAGKLDQQGLIRALEESTHSREPVLLMGTAFAFAYFLEYARCNGLRFRLPPRSRIMETGGFKGRVREIPRSEFYQLLQDTLGIPQSAIVNEYSMTELSSQFYDRSLVEFLKKRTASSEPRIKSGPPWARVRIVNPLTGQEVGIGERGLIRIYDLANLGSVLSIQTEDVGIRHSDGFEIVGRVGSAPPRGCSLEAEPLLNSVGEKTL